MRRQEMPQTRRMVFTRYGRLGSDLRRGHAGHQVTALGPGHALAGA